MSSDAFADLGRSLSQFAEGLRRLVDVNQRPTAGSPADKEADGEPYAGDWGLHPSGAVFATVLPTTWSCTDHLSVAGTVLEHHQGISSLYTLTRGAAESAAIACYLTEPGIGSLERVRRNLNYDLQAMHEDLKFPLVLGSGRRLFNDGILPATMRPAGLTVTDLGVIGTYEPAGPVRHGQM